MTEQSAGPSVETAADEHLEPGETLFEVEAGVDAEAGVEVDAGAEGLIDDDTMRRALEAILMVTDEPLPVLTLARTVGRPTGDVTAALAALAEEYTAQGRGFDLREVAGGWRYYTREEAAQYVERFVLDGQQARLTQAALETLAVVAYKQPVSRARVSAIRGVNVDGVMRTLVSRGLVEEAGADTESQATLYRTTSYFLERMGMQSLDDLPELAPYLPEMDDMEEELAAQAAQAADAESASEAESQADAETQAEPGPEAGAEPEALPGVEPHSEPEELPDSAYGPESVDEPESVLDAGTDAGAGMHTSSVAGSPGDSSKARDASSFGADDPEPGQGTEARTERDGGGPTGS